MFNEGIFVKFGDTAQIQPGSEGAGFDFDDSVDHGNDEGKTGTALMLKSDGLAHGVGLGGAHLREGQSERLEGVDDGGGQFPNGPDALAVDFLKMAEQRRWTEKKSSRS